MNDAEVLREAGIVVVVPTRREAVRLSDDLMPNPYAEPNWKRISGWLGAVALVSMTLLLYVVDEVSRRS